MFSSSTEEPSTATIRSPAFTPARKAGVSSMGETTSTPSSTLEMISPTPPNLPMVVSPISRMSSALRYSE